jgi:hypothetical protein
MGMKIPKQIVETVEAKYIRIHAKVVDSASYSLHAADGTKVADREDYVPGFFPEDHCGDYIILNIDIETGQVLNWNRPKPEDVAYSFGLIEDEEG